MKISNRKFFAGAFIVCILLAGGVSFYASSSPDGLEKVAEDIGFIETAKENTNSDVILSDYGVKGIDNQRLSTGAAGVIGVIATGAISTGFFLLIRRKSGGKK